MSDYFDKDPQNPKDPTWMSDVWDKKPVTGDISDGSGIIIKAEKTVVVTEGDGIGGKWPEVIKETIIGGDHDIDGGETNISDTTGLGSGGSKCSTEFGGIILKVGGTNEGITKTGGRIPVLWKEYDLKDGNGESVIIKAEQDRIGRTSEDIKDPTDTISQEDWFGGSDYIEGEGGYIEGDYGFSGEGLLIEGGWDAKGGYISDTNIPKHEVPKNGGEGLDHEWYIGGGSSNIEDPTWDVRWGGGEGAISADWGFSGVWDKQSDGTGFGISDTTGL